MLLRTSLSSPFGRKARLAALRLGLMDGLKIETAADPLPEDAVAPDDPMLAPDAAALAAAEDPATDPAADPDADCAPELPLLSDATALAPPLEDACATLLCPLLAPWVAEAALDEP